MRLLLLRLGLIFLAVAPLTGCEAIAGIFRAGFWAGVLIVGVLVVIIVAVIAIAKR